MNAECGICKDYFVNYTNLCAVPCGHVFHQHCITSWFEMGTLTCPQCRKPVKKSSSLKLYFDLVECEDNTEDIAVLKGHNDRLVQMLQSKDAEMCQLKRKTAEAEKKASLLKESVKSFENASRVLKSQVDALTGQTRVLAETNRLLKEKEKMIELCKTKLERYKGVQALSLPFQDDSNIREIGKDLCKNDLINLLCASKRDQKKLSESESSLADSLRAVNHENLVMKKKLDAAESEIRVLQQVAEGFKNKRQSESNISNGFSLRDELDLFPDSNTSVITPPKASPRPSSIIQNNHVRIEHKPFKRPRIEVGNRFMPKTKPALSQHEYYNGLGGSSRLDFFPQAKLRPCKVITQRKK